MLGSVTRQNVCQREAPSVAAASSWLSPTSSRTGATSLTTNGNETNTVASTIPGTAIAAIRTVNQNALTAAGVVIQSQAWLMPCSNVRMNTTPSGRRRSTPRYRSAAQRRERVAGRLSRTATPQPAKGEQDEQRDDEQHNRQR